MAEENAKLSFTEKIARARAEAASKASSQGNAPASAQILHPSTKMPELGDFSSDKPKFYFHSSIETTRILVSRGRKLTFNNHFYITDNPEEAAEIRNTYCAKKTGSIKFLEVSEMFYQSSTMIQPTILPLPSSEPGEVLSLTEQEQQLDAL